MDQVNFQVNGTDHSFSGDSDMPLLWYLRDIAGLKGTKFGCGVALCGACTVLRNNKSVRSCITPMRAVEGAKITTIEGLGAGGLHRVQRAWVELNVPQCGYCQSGQMLQAVALLEEISNPTDLDIDRHMAGNICRCGTYQRIRAAIRAAARGEV